MKIRSIRKLPGFSLIEMSIVLLVVGIIASLTLPLLTTTLTLQRQKTTEANKETLFRALAAYVLTNEHLPRPSLPTLQGESSSQHITVGIIPYQELGIPESMARDGYGNWFTYVVSPQLSDERNLSRAVSGQKFCEKKQGEALTLKSINGISAHADSEGNKRDFIAVILISHGPKGTGAFQVNKDERRSVSHDKEIENSNDTLKFHFKHSMDNDPQFDHKVYWVTRNNLMAVYANKACGSLGGGVSGNGAGAGSGSSSQDSSVESYVSNLINRNN